jgi:hypothetical protein
MAMPMTEATLSNVASSIVSQEISGGSSSRKLLSVYNDSGQVLYLKFGTEASPTSYTVQVAAAAYYELPNHPTHGTYLGVITGVWAAANGYARVTEVS